MTINELHTIVLRITGELKQAIYDLKTNDFKHLECQVEKLDEKVDKLMWIAGIGVGILIAIQTAFEFMH